MVFHGDDLRRASNDMAYVHNCVILVVNVDVRTSFFDCYYYCYYDSDHQTVFYHDNCHLSNHDMVDVVSLLVDNAAHDSFVNYLGN